MYKKTAQYYDEIYAAIKKDYPVEVKKAIKFIQEHKKSRGRKLLDVACGTGVHANLLNQKYDVEGIDLDSKMISISKKKYPHIKFHVGDMTNFEIKNKFDVITCLFSSIGYVKTKTNLQKAITNMAEHLVAGGVMLIEPWYSPDEWHNGNVYTVHVNKPELKITRISHSSSKRNISILEFQYLIGTSKGIQHSVEKHQLGLFSKKDYLEAFQKAGLKVIHDLKGLDGRGLYIGTKPLDKK